MSISRDKRIVEMELNNKNFESNAKVSLNTIDKLKAALKMDDADQGFYKVEKAAATVNLTPIIKGLDEIQNKFSAMGIFGIETMKRISNAAINAGEKMWASTFGQIKSGGSNRALKIANAQFKLEGLGVAWEQASKDINAAVDGTAYGFDAAANTASQLATAGVELGEAYGGMAHALKAVSGVAAMTNSSYEEIGYIFSQIASIGKLTAQDSMQLSTRGINVTGTLAKQLGKTVEEIEGMRQKGEINFALFAEAMNDAFGEQATKANNTFEGALSNVKSALSRIGEIWYGPFYQAAIKPLNAIRVAINNIKKAFSDGNDETRDFKDRLTDLMNIVSNIFTWLTEHVDLTFFNDIANGANKVLDVFNDVGHAIEKVLGIFKTDDAVSETEKLTNSVEGLTEAELEAAKAIWETGKYGNGQERIDNLLAAGFTEEGARRVQAAIDKFIESNYQWEEAEKAVAKQTAETAEETKSLSQAITSKFVRSFISARRTVSILGDAFKNIGAGIWEIIQMVGKSFAEVFDFEIIFKDIEKLAYKFRFFTELFKNAVTGNEKLKEIIDEIFRVGNSVYRVVRSVASIIFTIIGSLISVIKEVVGDLDVGEVSISKFTDKIAEWAENLAVIVKTSGVFVKIFKGIVDLAKILINYLKKLPSILKPVADKAIKVVDILLAKFKELTGIDLKSGIMKAVDLVKQFFKILSDPFAKGADGKTAIAQWAEDVKMAILGIFNSPETLFNKIKDWFRKAFEGIKANPSAIIPEGLFKSFGDILKKLLITIESTDINKLLKTLRNIGAVILVVTSVLTAMEIKKFWNMLQSPVETLKNLVGTIKDVFDTAQDVTKRVGKAIEINLMADAFVKVASGVAILAASVVGLGMVDTQTLVKGLTAVMICVAALAATVIGYNATIKPGMIKMLDTTMIQLGLSMAVMAGVVYAMGKMPMENLVKGTIMLEILTIMYDKLLLMNRVFRGGKNDIWKGIVALALAMDAMIPLVKILGEMNSVDLIKGIISMQIILADLSAAMLLMAEISGHVNAGEMTLIAVATGIMALAMNALIPFTELVGRMNFVDISKALIAFVIMLGWMEMCMTAMARVMRGTDYLDIAAGAISIAVVAASLNLLIPAISALGLLSSKYEGALSSAVAAIAGLLFAMMTVLGAISYFDSADILASAVSIGIIAASLNILIPALMAIGAMDPNQLKQAVIAIGGMIAILAVALAGLAALDAVTGHAVTIILAAIAIQIGEIAVLFIAGALALGTAAMLIGKAALDLYLSIDGFSNMNGNKFIQNCEKVVMGITIIAEGLLAAAPVIKNALKKVFSGLINGILEGIAKSLPVLFSTIENVWHSFIKTLLSNVVALVAIAVQGILLGIVIAIESATDDSNGGSLVERGIKAICEFFIQIFNALWPYLDEIATTLVDFTIAALNAYSNVLETRGDELYAAIGRALGITFFWIDKVIDDAKGELGVIAGKVVGYLIDGAKERIHEVWVQIDSWARLTIYKIKHHFGLDLRYTNDGNVMGKIGRTLIQDFIDAVESMFGDAEKMVGNFFGTLAGAFNNEISAFGQEVGADVTKLKEWIYTNAWGMHSPAEDDVKIGKNIPLGWLEGFLSELGITKDGIGNAIGGLKDYILDKFGFGDMFSGNGFDLSSLLNIDPNDMEIGVTPVLDTSSFDSDYSSFMNNYGLGDTSSYNFGTSSSLANDISGSTYGSNGFYTGAAVDNSELTASVQDIAERIGRLEVRMDTGALVGALYAGIDEKLGEKQILAGRGVYA